MKRKVLLTIATLLITWIVISIISGGISMPNLLLWGYKKLLILGFVLALVRSSWKNKLAGIPPKPLKEMLPTYVINYPVFLICAYVVIDSFIQISVIAFLIGWSVDYLWNDGNIFGIFAKLKNE